MEKYKIEYFSFSVNIILNRQELSFSFSENLLCMRLIEHVCKIMHITIMCICKYALLQMHIIVTRQDLHLYNSGEYILLLYPEL